MIRTLLVTLLVAVASVAAAGAAARQSNGDTGTLIVQEFVDHNNNGLYEPEAADVHERARVCRILVYDDLSDTILPSDWGGFLDTRIRPVTEAMTDTNGVARLELPAGRYTIDRLFCEDFDLSRFGDEPICCPDKTASPKFLSIRSEAGAALMEDVQTVDVVAGQTTLALVRYHPGPGISTTQTILAILTWVMFGALLFWLWRRYPTIRADARNPMRLVPKEPDRQRATWDDVFGGFVRKRERDSDE